MRANDLCRVAVVLSFVALPACQTTARPVAVEPGGVTVPKGGDPMSKMTITSAAFGEGKEIPAKHTCQGEDTSPPLSWSGVPKNAASLALIVDDPDAPDPKAPKMTWVHWVLYNIPPSAPGIPEGARELPAGATGGSNDWNKTTYGGPCPPIGRHRYFHKLYALDIVLEDLGAATKADLLRAMEGHIVA